MNTAKLIEGMIPDELRLASHPDAALVNEALATAITAMNESDSISLAGMRADVRKALTAYFNGTFSKHISEEDEAWGKMKGEVEAHKGVIEELRSRVEPETVYYKFTRGKPRPSMGTLTVNAADKLVTFMDGKGASGDGLYDEASGQSIVAATDEAIRKAGYEPFMVGSFESEGAKAVKVEKLIEEWDEFIRNEGTDFAPFNRKIRSMVDPATAQDIIDGQNTKFLRLMKQAFAANG